MHGNPLALDATLSALSPYELDALYFLGDVVGYLPGEVECLEMLAAHGVVCQKGNHEARLLGSLDPADQGAEAIYQLDAARSRLGSDSTAEIASWPITCELTLDGRQFLLVHGSPADPLEGYIYADTDLTSHLSALNNEVDTVVCAHTHRPFVRRGEGVRVVNVGSVGLPRDVGSLASAAIYDGSGDSWEIVRVRFDVATVLRRWERELHSQVVECLGRTSLSYHGNLIT